MALDQIQKGEIEKMLILAFDDSEKAETPSTSNASASFEVLINPESYTVDYKLKFSDDGQGQGTSGTQLKYEYTEPEEMSFDFLFDNTGIIDGKPRDSIVEDIDQFKEVLLQYKGDTHEPPHLVLVWGEKSVFKGRATEVSIAYKLFKPDGTPIRAVATAKFKASIEDLKRAAEEDRQSPDLTHVRKVKAGDTLPMMCYEIYGDARHYFSVAKVNNLNNFRHLTPGSDIYFPPIDKEVTA